MRTPVGIVGGGPGGAACAMFLAAAGIDSVVVEKSRFPRYHIGESMTGECGNVVRTLGLEGAMLAHGYPVKRGVAVFGPASGRGWLVEVKGRSLAGELVDAFTWQVRRSSFDLLLSQEARARGVLVLEGSATGPLLDADGAVRGIRVELATGTREDIAADVVVDASGQDTFLCHVGVTGRKTRGTYDRQVAVFSQVTGTVRDAGPHRDDTLTFYRGTHHWAWVIPLDDRVASVGVVAPGAYVRARRESLPTFLSRELAELHPELRRRIPEITFVEEVRAVPSYSYQVDGFAGRGFLCIGDAHRFIDPIFSFGLYVTMKEAEFAAQAIVAHFGGTGPDAPDPFAQYRLRCERGLAVVQDLIDGFWASPLGFSYLVQRRHPEMTDLLAGRVYDEVPSRARQSLARLAAGAGRSEERRSQ